MEQEEERATEVELGRYDQIQFLIKIMIEHNERLRHSSGLNDGKISTSKNIAAEIRQNNANANKHGNQIVDQVRIEERMKE